MQRLSGLRSLAPFLLAALLAQAGFRILIRPGRTEEIGALAAEAARLRAPIADDAGAEAGESARLTRELAAVGERVTTLRANLPEGGEAESVLHSLAALAAEEGIRFRRFAPGADTRLDDYLARAATVAAEGAFFDFVDFFERLALLPHLVLVEEAQFEALPDGTLRSRFVAVTVRRTEASAP